MRAIRKKTVILLGAGAAIPFNGPPTVTLTERIKGVVPLWLVDILDSVYCSYSFETVIAALEFLLDWQVNSMRKDEFAKPEFISLKSSLFSLASRVETKDFIQLWSNYRKCINNIIEAIKDYERLLGRQTEDHLYSFLNYLSNSGTLKIYTLNYDRLIPHLFEERGNKSLYDGFVGSEPCQPCFRIKEFVGKRITHYNLHGSIYLAQKASNHYRIEQWHTPQTLSDYAHSIHGGNPSQTLLFSPIITGYEKASRILSEPFTFGLSCFTYDCSTCTDLYIIGYSFSDPYINSIFRDYIDLTNANIRIIDYNDENDPPKSLLNHLEMNWYTDEPHNRAHSKYLYFGDRISLSLSGFEEFLEARDYELSSNI